MRAVCFLSGPVGPDEKRGNDLPVGSKSNFGSILLGPAVWSIYPNLHSPSSPEKKPQCTIITTSIKEKLTNSHETPMVSRDSLLSLVAFVRRLHEQRESITSGRLDDCPQGTQREDNHTNRSTAAASFRVKINERSRK